MKLLYTFLFCLLSLITQAQTVDSSNAVVPPTEQIRPAADPSVATKEGSPVNPPPSAAPASQQTVEVKLNPMTYLLLTLSIAIGPILIVFLFRKNKGR